MRPPTRVYRSIAHDSARWSAFEPRRGDIVITTPPKCGTTWTQMICALLVFQRPTLPRPLSELSPWFDMLTRPTDEVVAQLEAQPHRRFIKSHTPLDGLPLHDGVTYICVARDPRDVAISMEHHRDNFSTEAFVAKRTLVAGAEDLQAQLALDPPPSADSPQGRFWQWIDKDVPVERSTSSLAVTLRHFDEAFAARAHDNVVLLHYADLKADLEGEMRRLARRLDIGVPEARWAELVHAASFEAMRARADQTAPNAGEGLFKDNRQFFHSGTGGKWRDFFDADSERRYQARVAALTSPEVARWAHAGSSVLPAPAPSEEA